MSSCNVIKKSQLCYIQQESSEFVVYFEILIIFCRKKSDVYKYE